MRNRVYSGRRSTTGFALIEVLVSAALFSIGILGLVALQARSVQFSSDAEDRIIASSLANDLAGLMWTYQTVDVTSAALSGPYATWQARATATAPACLPNCLAGVVEAKAEPSTIAATGTTKATITITWKAANKASSASNSSYSMQVVIP